MFSKQRKHNPDEATLADVALDAERSVRLLASADAARVQLVRSDGVVLANVSLPERTPQAVRAVVGAMVRLRSRFADGSVSPPTAPPVLKPPPLTIHEAEKFDQMVGDRMDERGSGIPGILPLRVDRHPDGRSRIVWAAIDVPDGIRDPLPSGRNYPPAGAMIQQTVTPAELAEPWSPLAPAGWPAFRWSSLDAAPEWQEVADYRVRPTTVDAPLLADTIESALERSGYKHPAKLREVRQRHWKRVALALWRHYPVAPDVLAEYPELARYFAGNIRAAQSLAGVQAEREAMDHPDDPDVALEWSAQTGLLLHTRGKDPKIIAAIRGLRTNRIASFKWSSHLGAWFRPQSVGVSESTTNIDGVADALRKAGMVVAVERGNVGALGEANVRRQSHKFWRAERYAARGETALERASESEARAESIRGDLPVGAPTKRAERAEARAERAEAKAEGELEYAAHAAGRSERLARTAEGYETTVAFTRREVERRADEFAKLFSNRAKSATGAVRLASNKTDNLSEFRWSWLVVYPPESKLLATVSYDGRVLSVSSTEKLATPPGGELTHGFVDVRGMGRILSRAPAALREEVSNLDADAIYALAIAALPKFVPAAATDRTFDDPAAFVEALVEHAKRRGAQLSKAAGTPVKVASSRRFQRDAKPGVDYYRGNGDASWQRPVEMQHVDGMRFRFITRRIPLLSGTPQPLVVEFSEDVDFSGMSLERAFDWFLAGTHALYHRTPIVPPRHSDAAAKATPAPGSTIVPASRSGERGMEARTAARESASQRRASISGVAESVAQQARERLDYWRNQAEIENKREEAIARARGEGHTAGFYPTTPSLSRELVDLAGIAPGERVLEPSAGMGALVSELVARGAAVDAVEWATARNSFLREEYAGRANVLHENDFLRVPPSADYDAVVMNPPFSVPRNRHADQDHVMHALRFLRPGGRLVALMAPASADARHDARTREFHEWMTNAGVTVQWIPVAAGRFRISGTETPTVILVARAPKTNRWRGWR